MRLHDMQEIPQYDNSMNLGGTGIKRLTWRIGCCFQSLIHLFFAAVSVTTSRHMLYSPENQGRLRSVCLLPCPRWHFGHYQKVVRTVTPQHGIIACNSLQGI